MFRRFCGFGRDASGSTAVLFGLGAVVFFGLAGLAVDYVRGERVRSELQGSLDAAVLAGASVTTRDHAGDPLATAKAAFVLRDVSATQTSFVMSNGVIKGTATASMTTGLSRLLISEGLQVVAQSAATAGPLREPACVMAMHPHRKHTLELKGAVSVLAPDCHIYGNSDDANDVVDPHDPTNFLTGKSVQAVGYGHNHLENVQPPLEYAPEVLADPLASFNIPSAGSCDYNNVVVSAATITLDPGSYCGGLSIKSGATVTLNPGTYIVSGGLLEIAQSTLQGDGVTIVLADSRAELLWTDSTINLRAPASGSTEGMALLAVRQPSVHSFIHSAIDIYGVVYMPSGDLTWTNTGTPPATAKWTVWITEGFLWNGDGTIRINFNIDGADIPYPAALKAVVPRGREVRLVDLSAAN